MNEPSYGDHLPDLVKEKSRDAMTPGFAACFDPDEAAEAGAFVEDAISETDAIESSIDPTA